MGTAIKHPMWVMLSFVIFWHLGYLSLRPACECPDVKNYKWWLNPVWHTMLYICTYMAAVDVKSPLNFIYWQILSFFTINVLRTILIHTNAPRNHLTKPRTNPYEDSRSMMTVNLRIVLCNKCFFHLELNRIVELLFEILNHIEYDK